MVLRRGLHGESDRLCVVYTQDHGKLPVRFIGVNRPRAKLKALSEPLSACEYRLHMRDASIGAGRHGPALCLGGSILTTFPLLRSDLSRLLRGLELCELADRLTPIGQTNPEKFSLIVSALSELERAPAGPGAAWVCAAFALRLLSTAGFGVGSLQVSQEHRALWERLHHADLCEISALPEDPERLSRLEAYLLRSVERLSERPLAAARVRSTLSGSGERLPSEDGASKRAAASLARNP